MHESITQLKRHDCAIARRVDGQTAAVPFEYRDLSHQSVDFEFRLSDTAAQAD